MRATMDLIRRAGLMRGIAALNVVGLALSLVVLVLGAPGAWGDVTGSLILVSLLAGLISFALPDVSRTIATVYGVGLILVMTWIAQLGYSSWGPSIRPSAQIAIVLTMLVVQAAVLSWPWRLHKRPSSRWRLVPLCIGFGLLISSVLLAYLRAGLPSPTSGLPLIAYGIDLQIVPSPIQTLLGVVALGVSVSKWARARGTAIVALCLAAVVATVAVLPIAGAAATAGHVDASLRQVGVAATLPDGARTSPYSLADNLLPKVAATRTRTVVFYRGGESERYPQDSGLTLHAFVDLPPANTASLPGRGSVLIRIHGGGWSGGDAGPLNGPDQGAYFASRGYTVFDVQYGLADVSGTSRSAVASHFSIDDMVRQLGIFTHWLATNARTYGVTTRSVFASGGSAGGHLALAMVLASATPEYAAWFDPRVRFRGVLAQYPANAVARTLGLRGSANLIDVRSLIRRSSAPVLFFNGSIDRAIPPSVSEGLAESYRSLGVPSGVVVWPWGDHACDIYADSPFGQSILYAGERFMDRWAVRS